MPSSTKKQLLLFCMLMLFIGVTVKAQTSKIDELLGQWDKNSADTTQIKVLRKLSAAYTSVDPLKKFYYANQYLQLAKKNNIDSSISNAYLDMGIAYAVRSQLDSGLYYFKLGHEIAKESNYLPGIARGYVNMGFVLDRQDKKKESVKHYEESLKIYRKLNNRKGINQCIMNLGSLYFDLGEYKTADAYFHQVLANVRETPNDQAGLASALFSLGNSNRKLGNQQKSLEYFRQSLAIREKIGDLNGIALSNWGIGLVMNNTNKFEQALVHLKVALENNRKTKNVYQEAIVLMSISHAYLHLENYKKAEENIQLALEKAKEAESKTLVVQALENLVKIEAAQKKFDLALKHQADYIAINDSLNNSRTKKEVILSDLNRVNTDNKNLEEHNQKISEKITDYAIVIVIVTVLLLVVAILLLLYYKRNSENKNANVLLQKQKQEIAEVNEELKTQMEIINAQNVELEKLNRVKNKFFSIVSHDLRAPINSLKSLFEMYRNGILNEEELGGLLNRLEDTIYNTASFLDNLLEWSKSQLEGITVKPVQVELHQIVAHNIKLMDSQIRTKFIKVQNNVPTNALAFVDLNMIHVVIRNLLSNAIKFCKANDEVIFEAWIENENIICTIRDTGPGISDIDLENLFNLAHTPNTGTAGEKGYHIGLILCQDMMAQNHGSLKVDSQLGKGTTFYITLPVSSSTL
ncbi:sensor histidine kinase [Pedobacter chitinilyticus]|uniref:histidine kinase n=2 Tax=Pedobacter chitinilyticus TaxID=2233776 RepID=A0A443YRR4_9SPHI|nr:sensor histidine kinase [Pedobacter chitinilyticus]